MNNTYFILSNKNVEIERLHICTWDIIDYNAAIEIGFEFTTESKSKDVSFKISLPFIKPTDKTKCLMEALVRDDDNSKFIFNDKIKANKPINGDKRNGVILEFEIRNSLSVLPVKDINIANGICSFVVRNINHQVNNYVRIYIQTKLPNLSVVKSGITKISYIYDIKINEKRNLPTHINDLLNGGFTICNTIKQCFCFHVIPSLYNISYVNSNKLKNIRILESEAFNRYLPNSYKMKKDGHIIIFNKSEDSKDGTYTFFSEFEKETIGNKQIILAIGANILCSLLFGISSLRGDFEQGLNWYEKLPWEFWLAIITLVIFVGLLFIPIKRIWYFIQQIQKKI